MAKNITNPEVAEATATNTQVYKMPGIMEAVGEPTLKAIAMVFGLNPIRLYSVAKTPKEGEIYDAKQYNWDAIERFCIKRLDPDKGIATLDDVIMKALELDQELKLSDKRRSSEAAGSSKLEQIDVDGRTMPVRKFPNFDINFDATNGGEFPDRANTHPAGVHVLMLKKDPMVYAFVHQTRGYTVLRPVDVNGEFSSDTVKVISNPLLNLVGMGPSLYTREEIDKRYAEQAVLAQKAKEELEAKLAATATE